MTVETWLWLLATWFAFQGGALAFSVAQAMLARTCGVDIDCFEFGVGPALRRFEMFGTSVRLNLIPLGASFQMRSCEIDEAGELDHTTPGSFESASLGQRASILAAGPLASLMCGSVLLAAPVVLGASQLESVAPPLGEVHPSACGGLAIRAESSTMPGQSRLLEEVFVGWLKRVIFLESSEGWGGYFGAVATIARCGEQSVAAWVSLLAVIAFLGHGLVNLIPLPGSVGCKLVLVGIEVLTGLRERSAIRGLFALLAVVAAFALVGRMLWMDYAWLRATFWGP